MSNKDYITRNKMCKLQFLVQQNIDSIWRISRQTQIVDFAAKEGGPK